MSPSANSRPAASPREAARPKRGRYGDEQRRSAAARREPDDDADHRRMLIGLRGVDERERQQHQPGDRQDDGELLAPREPGRVPARGGERQHGDPGRHHGLHQRERRQPQGRHVHEPARAFGPERDEPAAVPQQDLHRPEGAARRERRQPRRRVVLQRIGRVGDQRGGERDGQAYPDGRHPANGTIRPGARQRARLGRHLREGGRAAVAGLVDGEPARARPLRRSRRRRRPGRPAA